MEHFIVSARKYRPQTFDDVVGQQALTGTLKRAITNRKLASAYLFCGPRGVGKTTCARIFAKAINCLNPQADGEACNQCDSCRSFNEQRSMNIMELNAAANNSVDDIRQIIEQVRIPPQIGKYKVIILDEVHMLSAAASNALLKTLEEPPSYVIFILATTEKQKIMPTILSRCQIFDFNRMEVDDIIGNLKMVAAKENITYEESALNIIAQKADGGMRDSLSIFDQVTNYSGGNITYESVLRCLNVLDYDYYFKMTDLLTEHKVSAALLLFNEIVKKGFNGGSFIGGLASHMRNLLVSRDASTLPLLDVAANVKPRYSEQAVRCSVKFLYKAIKLCDKCSNDYKYSYNKRLSVELTLIEAAQISDGDDSSGLRPSKTLKPLFKDTNPVAAAAPAGMRQTTTSTPSAATPARTTATNLPSPKLQETKPKTLIHTPRINIGHIIDAETGARNTKAAPSKPEAKEAATPPPTPSRPETVTMGEVPFTIEDVRRCWNQFVTKLSDDDFAVSGRLQKMEYSIENNTHIVANVSNPMVQKFLAPYMAKMQTYLQKELQNRWLTVETRIFISEHTKTMNDPQQIFNMMIKENAALGKLKDDLGLEIDY